MFRQVRYHRPPGPGLSSRDGFGFISSESSPQPQQGCCVVSPGRPVPGSQMNTRACRNTGE